MIVPTATITLGSIALEIEFCAEGMGQSGRSLFFAVSIEGGGCAVVPYGRDREGSTLFLPFPVDRIYAARVTANSVTISCRQWQRAQWSDPLPCAHATGRSSADLLCLSLSIDDPALKIWARRVEANGFGAQPPLVWAKDLALNEGWAGLLPLEHGPSGPTLGDFALPVPGLDPVPGAGPRRFRFSWQKPPPPRTRIYQLFTRLFSNSNERRKKNGTLAENGTGKFSDITPRALAALRGELHITHLWLTGILNHATLTAYPEAGKPADDPDLLKGLAGSPYAVRDCQDVSPIYAVDPKKRMEEFRALLDRAHAAGLKVIIDFVPNHVARSHASGTVEFGKDDDRSQFFSPKNDFYWLQSDRPEVGPPLRLPTIQGGEILSPTCRMTGGCDGLFEPEQMHCRVTGNNAATWSPSANDWYETVKLNYGHDFTNGQRAYPHAAQPDLPLPAVWLKMDSVLAAWQSFGVDGFRCDMAHMIPPEFWQWAVRRARERDPSVTFIAEAYNDDPMKVESGDPLLRGFTNVGLELLNAGFDAVYDLPAYKGLKRIYDGPGWANDLDSVLGVRDGAIAPDHLFHRSTRFAENHDEVRLASPHHWAGIGMEVGRPVSAILFGLSRGPILIYNGQEVGEPALGTEGYSADNGRTTIFDYWSMPELSKWVNSGRFDEDRLSATQRDLRAFYGRLLGIVDAAPFREGEFLALNGCNVGNSDFGRVTGDPAGGHWLYAYLRYEVRTGEAFLIVANLHPRITLDPVRINLPDAARRILPDATEGDVALVDRLSGLDQARMIDGGICIVLPPLPPLTPGYFHFSPTQAA